VRQGALGRGKLHHAEREGGHGGKGVQLDRRTGIEQRGERHGRSSGPGIKDQGSAKRNILSNS
jgi:hypothetical protein